MYIRVHLSRRVGHSRTEVSQVFGYFVFAPDDEAISDTHCDDVAAHVEVGTWLILLVRRDKYCLITRTYHKGSEDRRRIVEVVGPAVVSKAFQPNRVELWCLVVKPE